MSDNSERDPLEVLAEEFVARQRRGERPSLTEYMQREPDRAEEIRELFPALIVMEKLKSGDDHTAGFDESHVAAPQQPPERLGDYRILREVGRGGMGVVYEAEQISLGRHVALKVLPPHSLLNPTYSERFRREARAAARLHHTNIVPVFGTGEAGGVHYYAMQFIRGEGLDAVLGDVRRLRRPGSSPADTAWTHGAASALISGSFAGPPGLTADAPLPAATPRARDAGSSTAGLSTAGRSDSEYYRSVARIGLQVAEALAYAHKQGVLHRDIKPSNLLLDMHGTVWVTDFGLAKADGADELTHVGDIVGTVRFMAPERFDGQSSPQSDIYSLGVTLYEMLALRPAFDASHRGKLIEQVLHDSPPPLARIDRRIPRDLDTVVQKCLAKEPRDRYASADALADDLRRFLADRPIQARRATLPEQLWRWRRRNPALAALSAAVFGLLLVVALGSSVATFWLQSALKDSENHRRDADTARDKTERQRWEATFEQSEANRLSRRPGQQIRTLQLLRQCAEEARRLNLPDERRADLRNAVIATLAMPDLYLEEVGNLGPGQRVDFDNNLEQFAVVDDRGNCSIRRTGSDQELFHIEGAGEIAHPRFSRTGRYLALGTDAGQLQLWERDGAGWRRRLTLAGTGSACFRADDRIVAFCHNDGSLSVYELPEMKRLHQLAADTIQVNLSADVHPTEPLVVCASYYSTVVQIRDLRTGRVLARLDGDRPCNPIWHPNGRDLIVPEGEGGRILHLEWDPSARTLTRRRTFITETGGPLAAFNPAGDRFAVIGWNGMMHLFDFGTGRLLFRTPSMWRVMPPRFDASGERLAGAVSRQGGRLAFWRVADGRAYRTLVHEPLVEQQLFCTVAIHPNGRLLAGGIARVGVGLWDLSSGRQLAFVPQTGVINVQVAFDQTGALYTTSWAGTFRWPVRAIPGLPDRLAVGPPEVLPFGRGQSEFSVSDDGNVRVKGYGMGYGEYPYAGGWVQFADHADGAIRLPNIASVSNTSVSRDGRWVATGENFGAIHIWEIKDGHRLEHAHVLAGSGPFSRFSPDNRWLWTELNGGQLYSVGDWQAGPACEGSNGGFSPRGDLLATTLMAGTVILWNARTGRQLARFEDPNLDASGAPIFSPDGARLITFTSGNSKGIHVWDLRRIRRELKDMDLDWDMPDYPPEPDPRPLDMAEFVRPELAVLPADWQPTNTADRWRRQLAVYSVALALQPVNPQALLLRAHAHHQLRQDRDAIADLDLALALRPRHAETYHWRAHAHEGLEEWAQAERDFSAALALKPDDPHFLDRRGRCRVKLGHAADGIADLERSLALRSDQLDVKRFIATACNNRAWKLLTGPEAERDAAAALKLAEQAARYKPDTYAYLNTRGVAEYRSGRFQDALVSLNRSLELSGEKDAGFNLFFMAMCQARLGRKALAAQTLTRAERWLEEHEHELSPVELQELRAIDIEAQAAVAAAPAR